MSIGKCYIEEERRKKSCFSSYYRAMIQFWSWNLLKFEFLFAISICFINTKHCTTLKNKWISDLICPPSQLALQKSLTTCHMSHLVKQIYLSRSTISRECLWKITAWNLTDGFLEISRIAGTPTFQFKFLVFSLL